MPIEYRILLVDDDREFADLLCWRLLKCGFRVTKLYHPRQALEAASQRDYDVAVLDRDLPEIDGVRLMQMLKSRFADLRVVFLSGHDDPAGKEIAMDCGAFAYLAKPCPLAEIEATIERAVECRGAAAIASTVENTHVPREPTESNVR